MPPPTPGAAATTAGVGSGLGLAPQGLPQLKPPYGRITAINMDKGAFVLQIAHGETPDYIRNHPALKGLNIPRTGQSGFVGLSVTKTLLIAADPQITTSAAHPHGAMLRAYNKATGQEVGALWMPAPQSGSPMTYLADGKQYVIVPVSGASYSGEFVAFRLPD
jgi:quinoprotein glucose dehydrogenase